MLTDVSWPASIAAASCCSPKLVGACFGSLGGLLCFSLFAMLSSASSTSGMEMRHREALFSTGPSVMILIIQSQTKLSDLSDWWRGSFPAAAPPAVISRSLNRYRDKLENERRSQGQIWSDGCKSSIHRIQLHLLLLPCP